MLASLAACELAGRAHWTSNFYLLPFRAWELLVGACTAVLKPQLETLKSGIGQAAAPVGLALVIGAIFLLDSHGPVPSLSVLVPVVGVAMVLAFAEGSNWCARTLSFWPMRFIGLISYSAYLWHQPVIAFLKLQPVLEVPHARSLSVVLSLVLAAVSWRYVEQPFRSGKLVMTPLKLGGASIAVAATAAGLLLLAVQVPTRLPGYTRGVDAAGLEVVQYVERKGVFPTCHDKLIDAGRIESCHFGAPGAEPAIILWGDSYAEALLQGLDAAARRNGISGVAYFLSGCPPIPGLRRPDLDICDSDPQAMILDHIASRQGHSIVLLFGNLEIAFQAGTQFTIDHGLSTPALAHEKIRQARSKLNASGKQLVLVEQGPLFPEEAAQHYLTGCAKRQRAGYDSSPHRPGTADSAIARSPRQRGQVCIDPGFLLRCAHLSLAGLRRASGCLRP